MKKENFEFSESNFLRIGQDLSGLLILENLAPLTPQVDMALKSQWIMCEAVIITTFILDHPQYCFGSSTILKFQQTCRIITTTTVPYMAWNMAGIGTNKYTWAKC